LFQFRTFAAIRRASYPAKRDPPYLPRANVNVAIWRTRTERSFGGRRLCQERPRLRANFSNGLAVCCVSDGESRHSEKPVDRNPADDRGAATAAIGAHGVERSRIMSSSQTTGEARLDDSQFLISRLGRPAMVVRDPSLRGHPPRPRDLVKDRKSGESCVKAGPIRRIPVEERARCVFL
jgi:hypothetical protein